MAIAHDTSIAGGGGSIGFSTTAPFLVYFGAIYNNANNTPPTFSAVVFKSINLTPVLYTSIANASFAMAAAIYVMFNAPTGAGTFSVTYGNGSGGSVIILASYSGVGAYGSQKAITNTTTGSPQTITVNTGGFPSWALCNMASGANLSNETVTGPTHTERQNIASGRAASGLEDTNGIPAGVPTNMGYTPNNADFWILQKLILYSTSVDGPYTAENYKRFSSDDGVSITL